MLAFTCVCLLFPSMLPVLVYLPFFLAFVCFCVLIAMSVCLLLLFLACVVAFVSLVFACALPVFRSHVFARVCKAPDCLY